MMHLSQPCPTKLWIAVLSLAFGFFLGCERGPQIAQLRGKVLYKDGSVPQGGVRVVRFEPVANAPAEQRQTATGAIQLDGTFEMCRRVPGDGVLHGDYAVTFTVWKGPREPVSFVDDKFTNSATTPYHLTVEGDRDDLFFEIERAALGQQQTSR